LTAPDAAEPSANGGAQVIALPARATRRTGWRRHAVPAAGIAAGLAFVSVMVLKLPQPSEGAAELASAQLPARTTGPSGLTQVVSVEPAATPGPVTGPAAEPGLPMQSYLQAHRAMTAGFAIDPGPGQLRRVAQEQGAR
jgi:hypothetical protein